MLAIGEAELKAAQGMKRVRHANGLTHTVRQRVQSTTLSNALAESLFATVECELLQRVRLTNREEAKTAIFRFLEGFYNRRRRHSALGYVAPVEFERSWSEARVAAAKRGPAPAPAEFLEA